MNLKKVIALFLSVMFVVVCFTTAASAAGYRTAGTKGTDGISDAYSASIFYKNFQKIQLTGDGRIDTVAIALSQVGYQEGNSASDFGGTFAGSGNYTEFNWNMGDFGSGYGGSSYAWCASFVSFALFQANTHNYNKFSDICRNHTDDSKYIWREISCIEWLNQLDRFGYFKKSKNYGGSYTPQTGDLIFFGDTATTSSHIGLVVYCDGTTVYTVEGNTSQAAGLNSNGGGVYFKSYALSNARIRGYGVLPYKTNSSAIKPDYSCKTLTTGIYINTNYENAGIDKQTYQDAACTRKGPKIGKNTMFEVLEFVSETVAKCKIAVNGTEMEMYMKFDDGAKLVQAVSYGQKYNSGGTTPTPTPDPTPTPTPTPDTDNTFVAIEKGNGYIEHTANVNLSVADMISVSGNAKFSQNIYNSGFYFDSDKENVYWNSNFLSEGESADISAGNTKDMNFDIKADISDLSVGEHTVNFMLKLQDGTFVIIKTVSFTVEEKPAPDEDSQAVGATPTEEESTTAEAGKSSGCGSTIGGISAIVLALATTLALCFKKKRR